ncbi:YopX family protein [Siminovitchia terrae]|uniref:YopX family protein n=1 Tax=Siminovitchia terrae TaxID=1914933 RepID=UPI0035E44922
MVDSKTVGQYIGRKDKNMTEIYKGDIWWIGPQERVFVVAFDEDRAGWFSFARRRLWMLCR